MLKQIISNNKMVKTYLTNAMLNIISCFKTQTHIMLLIIKDKTHCILKCFQIYTDTLFSSFLNV